MAEHRNSDSSQNLTAQTSRPASRASLRSSLFKYYIHDGVESCRLQLIGELSEAEVPELTGCWSTVKTTLGSRKLVLDLRRLQKTDECGREWLLAMVREGAVSIPESYFRDHLANPTADASHPPMTGGKLAKLSNLLRGDRDLGVTSSTRVR